MDWARPVASYLRTTLEGAMPPEVAGDIGAPDDVFIAARAYR